MNGWKIYWRYVTVILMAKMQYPLSFAMVTIATFFASAAPLLGIYTLFSRFDSLMGWSVNEVVLMYGIINLGFGLSDVFVRGFGQFASLVKSGDFDLLLLRPRNTALQVAARDVHIPKLGTVSQAVVVLAYAIYSFPQEIHPVHYLLIGWAVLGGACLFYGLFIVQATLVFWTTETPEVMNIVTYGGADLGQYPISIYKPWLRRFFTFFVPIACITYFPMLTLSGREDVLVGTPHWFGWLTPAAGVLFFYAALMFWQRGVQHYRSSGS
jgi:ABC-2 type transport system permease protein